MQNFDEGFFFVSFFNPETSGTEPMLRNYFFGKNSEKIDHQKLHLLFFHSLLSIS